MWSQVGLRKHHYEQVTGGDGIPVELFQILKDDAVKVLHSICQQILKTQQWPQEWERSVFISIPKKGDAKECSNYCTIALISQASKVMRNISKPGFSNTWTVNFQMFKKRQRNQRSSCQHPLDHQKSKWVPEKHQLCFIYYNKVFDCVDHNKLWKILKVMGIPDHLTHLLRNLYAGQEATVWTGHGTTDWFQRGKGVCQGCMLSPCLFNLYAEYIMRNADWMKHKLESRLPGEIPITSATQLTSPLWQKVKKN